MLVVIVAIVFFIIGRLTAKYKLALKMVADDVLMATTSVAAPAPMAAPAPAPIPATMTDNEIYSKLFNLYVKYRTIGNWRSFVPSDIREECVRRRLSGNDHGICCDLGSGMHIPDLSL